MKMFSSHDGGRLLGEQSHAIHHSLELQVAKIHGEARGTRKKLGLEGRPLWSRLDYPFPTLIEKPILKKLVQFLRIDIEMY
jgi:hypothetical protein